MAVAVTFDEHGNQVLYHDGPWHLNNELVVVSFFVVHQNHFETSMRNVIGERLNLKFSRREPLVYELSSVLSINHLLTFSK